MKTFLLLESGDSYNGELNKYILICERLEDILLKASEITKVPVGSLKVYRGLRNDGSIYYGFQGLPEDCYLDLEEVEIKL